jgi:imidazolonepropionase
MTKAMPLRKQDISRKPDGSSNTTRKSEVSSSTKGVNRFNRTVRAVRQGESFAFCALRGLGGESHLLLTDIGQLLTLHSGQPGPRRGAALRELSIITDAAVLCGAGQIISVGRTRDAKRDAAIKKLKKSRHRLLEIDCGGRVVLPGFVDSHTHPAFVGPRLLDFEKRTSGATYEEIAAAGGGILSSVDAVRKATRADLARRILLALHDMALHGTTTVEAKSGYGLDVAAETKSLEAIRDAARRWPGTVIATLLGAHVLPREIGNDAGKYVRLVCDQMVPRVARAKLAQFVDVFIERGAFNLEQAKQVFDAAQKHGLGIRAHACQFSTAKLGPLLRFHPASLDHMDGVGDDDIAELARRDIVATLLPGANYFLGLGRYPPARKLIDSGVAVALATDYNPGTSPTTSMPFVLSLACTQMRMSPPEAIAAATINGAHALRVADRKGSVETGKDADLAIFDVRDYREIPYWFGTNRCWASVLRGQWRGAGVQ